jgi:hypothetical protein
MKEDLAYFLNNTIKTESNCLEWTKCLNTDGYPRTSWRGSSNGKVHRIVYELYNGVDISGYVVRHKCDNPKCVNPEHLEIGSHTDNMKDRDSRDRHGAAKIQSKDVNTICFLYSTKMYTQKEIGDLFGINSRTVSSIIKGTHWKHVARSFT